MKFQPIEKRQSSSQHESLRGPATAPRVSAIAVFEMQGATCNLRYVSLSLSVMIGLWSMGALGSVMHGVRGSGRQPSEEFAECMLFLRTNLPVVHLCATQSMSIFQRTKGLFRKTSMLKGSVHRRATEGHCQRASLKSTRAWLSAHGMQQNGRVASLGISF